MNVVDEQSHFVVVVPPERAAGSAATIIGRQHLVLVGRDCLIAWSCGGLRVRGRPKVRDLDLIEVAPRNRY